MIGAALVALAAQGAVASTTADPADDRAGEQQPGEQRPSVDEGDDILVTGRLERFGATKSQTPIVETARSISIETERDFRDKGFETLDDALGYTAGVTAEPFGFDMRGDFPAIRGLSVPQYRDNLQFLFGNYNNPRPELYLLEQVEVLKGPASVLYGAGSPGGILNAVTKRPFDGTLFEARARLGSFDRYEVMGDVNGAIPGTGGTGFARLTALYRDTGTQIDAVDEQKIVIAPSVSARPTPDTVITLLTAYTSQRTDSGHQFLPLEGTLLDHPRGRIDPFLYAGEPGFNRFDSESVSATLIAEQRIAGGLFFEAVGRYVASSADYNQAWPAFSAVGAARLDADGNALGGRTFYIADNRSEQAALDARLRAQFTTGPIAHELLGGIQVQDVLTDSDTAQIARGPFNLFDPTYGNSPSEAELEAIRDANPVNNRNDNHVGTLAFYLSDQLTVGPLILNAGVRHDRVDNRTGPTGVTQRDEATSVSAGALFRGPLGLSPYVSYAESFNPVVGLDALTGAQRKPQRGRQYEAGVKWAVPGDRAIVTVAAFDIAQSNLNNPQALVGASSQQEGVAKIRGIEVEAQAAIGGLRLDANYSLLDTEDPNGFQLSTIPRHQASLFAIYRFSGALDGLRVGGGVRHVGSSESSGFTPQRVAVTIVTDAYTVGDLSAGFELGAFDLSLTARNITGERYFTTCLARGDCYPGEARSVVATIGYRL